jgi:hypothetical protein
MRKHAHLPAMVGFVRKHVAEHLHARRPGLGPAVSEKLPDAALTVTERFGEHFFAASGALSQSSAGLPRRAVCTVELSRNLQVRSRKPDPLATHIVQVREDGHNGTGLAGRLGAPRGRVKVLDNYLVHAVVDGKYLDCSLAELRLNLGWTNILLTRGHSSLLLACPWDFPSISVVPESSECDVECIGG